MEIHGLFCMSGSRCFSTIVKVLVCCLGFIIKIIWLHACGSVYPFFQCFITFLWLFYSFLTFVLFNLPYLCFLVLGASAKPFLCSKTLSSIGLGILTHPQKGISLSAMVLLPSSTSFWFFLRISSLCCISLCSCKLFTHGRFQHISQSLFQFFDDFQHLCHV